MTVREIRPRGRLEATVTVPGSKSHTQRALIMAALADGESLLEHPLEAEDTERLATALEALGARIRREGGGMRITGTAGRLRNPGEPLFLGNNGTAMRFLAGLVAIGRGAFTLTGSPRLCERPLGPLLSAIAGLGARPRCLGREGYPPVSITADGLRGGRVVFHGIESSQYVSSLLIASPYASGDVEIALSGPLVSTPYVAMTLAAMEAFGVPVRQASPRLFRVPAGRGYRGRRLRVEGDASSASYFFLAAALCGGTVQVLPLDAFSGQGDLRLLQILSDFGCRVQWEEGAVAVTGGTLVAGNRVLPLGDMPDMVPTVAMLAACTPGCTILTEAAHLRLKESDRLAAIATELGKTGIAVEERPDGLMIEGGRPRGAEIATYDDHRIAMAFAILGLVAPGMRIRDPECVQKSFPGFWNALEGLYR